MFHLIIAFSFSVFSFAANSPNTPSLMSTDSHSSDNPLMNQEDPSPMLSSTIDSTDDDNIWNMDNVVDTNEDETMDVPRERVDEPDE